MSRAGAFDSSNAKYSAGDFDADGLAEVRALYGYGGANTKIWSFELAGPGSSQYIIDVTAPPLTVPGVAGWGAGVALTAFYWDRDTLVERGSHRPHYLRLRWPL